MKKNYLIAVGILLTFGAFAQNEIKNDYSRFENITKITVPEITTPKVIIMETPNFFTEITILLNDQNEVISHKWIREVENIVPIEGIESSSSFEGRAQNMIDQNHATSLSFDTKNNEKKITLKFKKLTEISGIHVYPAEGIILPKYITINGTFQNNEEITIINKKNFSTHIPFPQVNVISLEISLDTPHFLRINEIEIYSEHKTKSSNKLVFFAESNKTYTLHSTPHFGQKNYLAKTYQPLSTDTKTPVFVLPNPTKNSNFDNDFDNDGITDEQDLCPKVSDPQNIDLDKNNRGDVCEDPDQDGIMSIKDNCPFVYNPNQKDIDLDKAGDLCDNSDDPVLEKSKYLLMGIFALAALFLGFLVWKSLKK